MYIFFKRLHLYSNLEAHVKHFTRYRLFLIQKDRVDWGYISAYQRLSDDFIREFKGCVDWLRISRHQKLSEEFIREFCDRVSWYYIFKWQKLSKEFRQENFKE